MANLTLVAYVVLQLVGLAFLFGWAVRTEARRDAGHAAHLVLQYNQYARKQVEAQRVARVEIAKELRAIRTVVYRRPWWRRCLHRYLGETPAMKARLDHVRSLIDDLHHKEAVVDHYHVMVRTELRRLGRDQAELVDALEKLLS